MEFLPTILGISLWSLIPGFIAKKKGRNFWGYYFLSWLISPLISMIVTLFLKPVEKDPDTDPTTVPSVSTNNTITTETEKSKGNTIIGAQPAYCKYCGAKLPENSKVCEYCDKTN